MNEAETRAELIDPKIREAGWGDVEDAYVKVDDEAALEMAYAVINHINNRRKSAHSGSDQSTKG